MNELHVRHVVSLRCFAFDVNTFYNGDQVETYKSYDATSAISLVIRSNAHSLSSVLCCSLSIQ